MVYFLVQKHFKKWNFSRRFKLFSRFTVALFSGCKNKTKQNKTKQKNTAASKMKPFMTLVDGLFGKQLNITRNPISDDPRSSLSILKKRV